MKTIMHWIGCVALTVWLSGCAVMSQEIRDKALPPVSFADLIAHVDQYKGETVIEGGYIVSVENLKDQTRIVAVQTTLGIGQRPDSKDLSKGRLILVYDGFLDPEVYTKDRQITVGGRILDSSVHDPKATYPYLKIALDEIHLWPVRKPATAYPYWYDDYGYPYGYPWGWWGYPHWRRPYW
jgi:outer membrane lipoprotein